MRSRPRKNRDNAIIRQGQKSTLYNVLEDLKNIINVISTKMGERKSTKGTSRARVTVFTVRQALAGWAEQQVLH